MRAFGFSSAYLGVLSCLTMVTWRMHLCSSAVFLVDQPVVCHDIARKLEILQSFNGVLHLLEKSKNSLQHGMEL